MKLYWHVEAKIEADQAAKFYKNKRQGLEKVFINRLEDAIYRIQKHPLLYKNIGDDVRKCRLKQFPIAVVFRLQPNHIEVVAIMHLRREPGYWAKRVGNV